MVYHTFCDSLAAAGSFSVVAEKFVSKLYWDIKSCKTFSDWWNQQQAELSWAKPSLVWAELKLT